GGDQDDDRPEGMALDELSHRAASAGNGDFHRAPTTSAHGDVFLLLINPSCLVRHANRYDLVMPRRLPGASIPPAACPTARARKATPAPRAPQATLWA
ncbi:MAG TPA: hypothetical protein VK001_14060, partial [Geminicoccaceae bacterium]|nr:hypothetical protein [Geminicoccaceae bacterium]